MPATTFLATIKNGKLQFTSFKAWQTFVSQLEGCAIEVTIKKQSKRKSTQANRYYFKVVVQHVMAGLKELQGVPFTKEEAHEVLKQYCNGKAIETKIGLIQVGQTTKGMSNEDFTAYVNRCKRFAFDYLNVPIPDSQDYFAE